MSSFINYWIPNLSKCKVSAELMEDLDADGKQLYATLRDFIGINRFTVRARRVLRTTIIADMRRRRAREVSILDVAAGGCDIGLWFARYCRGHGITLRAISACGRYGFVVTDLERHRYWYLAFTVLGAMVWRKGYTLADGRMSIRRGFKRKELERYAAQAGIDVSIGRAGFGHWRITTIRGNIF